MSTRINTVHLHAGRLVLKDSSGAIPVAELTDCQISIDATDKDLPSEYQAAQMSIRSGLKVTIKAKVQRVLSIALHAAMAGGAAAVTAGSAKAAVEGESGTITAGSVTVTGGANFVEDLGVKDNAGNAMEPVAAAPQVGQYIAGSAGVGTYTFNAAEVSPVSFSYVKSSTGGETVTVTNQPQAESPYLAGWFWSNTKQPDGTTKKRLRHFERLVPSKLTEAQKRGDWADSDFEATAIAKADGLFYQIHHS